MADRLPLHDVEDAAAFVGAIASASGLALSWAEREDLEAFLLAECWKLSERFEPGGFPFSNWAWRTLRLRVVDWQRQRFGRTRWRFAGNVVYERPARVTVSLDDGDDRDLLVGDVDARPGDSSLGWNTDLGGILRAGDRQEARDLRTLGLRPRR